MLFICCFYTVNKKKNEEGKRIRERRGKKKIFWKQGGGIRGIGRRNSRNREKGFGEQGEGIRETGRKYLCNCEKIFV